MEQDAVGIEKSVAVAAEVDQRPVVPAKGAGDHMMTFGVGSATDRAVAGKPTLAAHVVRAVAAHGLHGKLAILRAKIEPLSQPDKTNSINPVAG